MSLVEWRGYPVAQYQNNWAAEHVGHHLEIESRSIWHGRGWVFTWDAYVDDESVGTNFTTLADAKKACVEYVNKLLGGQS